MTIEEKAKCYDEAIERAKKIHNEHKAQPFDVMLKIFPELEELEDEKIRKELIAWLKNSECQTLPIDRDNAAIAWLEKQGEDKKEIKNFNVLPGLYKCVHRMFDGTPDGRLLFEVGNIYKCLSKHDRAEFEVSYGHSVYLEDPVVCKHFIPFEKQGEQKSAWSKEDIRNIEDIDSVLFYDKDLPEDTCVRLRNWLKSLRPQSQWKPSDEQIEGIRLARSFVVDDFGEHPTLTEILIELEEQLQKIKENKL